MTAKMSTRMVRMPWDVSCTRADGRMAAHLMRRGRALLRSENSRETTPDERAAAFLDYFSYCGPYTVQQDAQTVTHHVLACSSPNWVGTDQVRAFRFSGDALILGANARTAPRAL